MPSATLLKRKVLAFLFLLVTYPAFSTTTKQEVINLAIDNELHHSLRWKALLHYDQNKAHISDENFLLSKKDFSLKNELIETIKEFFRPSIENEHAICRFPARFLWIKKSLNLKKSDFPEPNCINFEEFKQKAPADDIQLIFASENVTSPSSMMGHSFIKLSGKNKDKFAEHAVSYYTIINTFNLPKVMYDSVVTGMTGLFSLTPYQKLKNKYLNLEKRNIWEYDLSLSEYEKTLVHYHVWELKNIKSEYFFTRYNCATVTYFLLASGKPELLSTTHDWITPIDVVKLSKQYSIISNSLLLPSNNWKIKMLQGNLSDELSNKTQQLTNNFIRPDFIKSLDYKDKVFTVELLDSYTNYLYMNKDISAVNYNKIKKIVSSYKDIDIDWPNFDISLYKSPINTPDDTQLSIATGNKNNLPFVSIQYLPTAHRLIDDNRQYLTENELRLGDIKVIYFPETHTIELEELQLYSVISLNPRNRFTGGISGGWRLGIEPHFDEQFEKHLAVNVSGDIGISAQISTDIIGYALAGLGYGYANSHHYLYTAPKIGFIVNEIFDMKTLLQASYISNQITPASSYVKTSITQSLYISKKRALFISVEKMKANNIRYKSWELSYTIYY